MSPHHPNTTNPKYQKIQQDYALAKAAYFERNAFLMELIDSARVTNHVGDRRLGYTEIFELLSILDETELTASLTDAAAMQDPTVFWTLMDCAKVHQAASGEVRAIRAVVFFYEYLDKHDCFTDEFKKAKKSPYWFIRRAAFLKRLCTEYTCADDVFIVNYSNIHGPVMLILNYRNKFLRSLVVESFIRDQSRNTVSQNDTKELCNMEEVFGHYADSIHRLEDLNADILTYAKDYIMNKYTDDLKLRMKYMKHLWCIFRYAVVSNPDKAFFEGSHLWNATLILNHHVPLQIARGFVPVIVETCGSIPAYEKVLFVYTNGEYFGANGVTYGMFSVDFSNIRTELYRWLDINYIAKTDQRKHPIVGSFLKWLEQLKACPGHKYKRINWIYADELCSYRIVIANKTRNAGSRNAYITTIVSFLRWAAGTNKLHLERSVFKYFDTFKHKYAPKPRSLTTCRKKAIETALLQLAERDSRYLLVLNIFNITLRSDIRSGQLCSLNLERMTWNEDGTSSYLSRVKNRGCGMVKTDFSKQVTALIRKAIELTEDIRSSCPVEGPKTCLYLYRGIRSVDDEIAVMDLQRYNEDLADACDLAGVKRISSGNVRDTRQTAVAKFAHKHNLNDAQIATLTKHAMRTSLNSYNDLHIDDLLMAQEMISLGSLDPIETLEKI